MARRSLHVDAPGWLRAARGTTVLFVALALAFGSAVAASAAPGGTTAPPTAPGATVPPSSTPPTTVALLPPPPPFTPGDDFGRLLLQHFREGNAALGFANADIANSTQVVARARDDLTVAQHAQIRAVAHAHVVARRLVAIRTQIKALAVQAYIMGSGSQLTGALASFQSAKDVVALSRNLTLVHSSHDRLFELVDLVHREQIRAQNSVNVAIKTVATATQQFHDAEASLAGAQQRRANALAEIDQANGDQARFFADATTSASPIMGPTLLTADDLVAYIDSLHLHPKLTVPLRTLAGYYITEGEAEGVRGDVAFAQSILETGAFMFPGHGLLIPTDNNFAGIDACDSCKHGDLFATAQIGVRAQIQLLRVYADPTLKKVTDYANPLALLHEPHFGGSGHSRTWYSLGGTWATGPNYGFHVYDIYMKMVKLSRRAH